MKKTLFEEPRINLVEKLTAELMMVNRQLEESNRNLRKSEATRAEMFSNISHDLRAPLTAIRGALDRLCEGEHLTDQDRRSMLAIIDRRVATLEHLVGELYYSVAIEQPGFSLHTTALDIAPFLEEWWITHKYGNQDTQRQFFLEIPADLKVFAEIDPQSMVRVLDNLMENAQRFSQPQDAITLGCCVTEEGRAVELYLQDRGWGIAPDVLPHIFERTYTASSSRTPSAKSGSGLGLHIARAIVEQHGGTIRCESALGQGSTFFITIPAIQESSPEGHGGHGL